MVILFIYQFIFAQALSVQSMDRIYKIYKSILIHLFEGFTMMMAGVKGRWGGRTVPHTERPFWIVPVQQAVSLFKWLRIVAIFKSLYVVAVLKSLDKVIVLRSCHSCRPQEHAHGRCPHGPVHGCRPLQALARAPPLTSPCKHIPFTSPCKRAPSSSPCKQYFCLQGSAPDRPSLSSPCHVKIPDTRICQNLTWNKLYNNPTSSSLSHL